MKSLLFLTAVLALAFTSCGDSPSSTGVTNPDVIVGGGDTPDPDKKPSGNETQQISIKEFLQKADQQTTYRLVGKIRNLANTVYGNFDLVDETGTIYIYGLLDKNGQEKNFASLGLKVGDELTLEGKYALYNGSPEIKNAQYISHVAGNEDQSIGFTGSKEYARRVEVPKLLASNLFVEHSVAYENDTVMNYCFEYDPEAYHSRWVAFRFDAVTRMTNVSRSDEPFMDDPDMPASLHIGSSGFGNQYYDLEGVLHTMPSNKFDRGHICASADRYLSKEANEQTFYMTNMSPQISKFNSPYWSSFENYVRKRGRDAAFADTLFVVKGGTIAEGQIMGHVKRTNGAMVTIPKYYYMALLRCKNDQYSAIAFWMEHKDYGNDDLSNSQIADKAISIDELEDLTGIDFFHNLPDDIEANVEKELSLSVWGLQ